MRVVGVALSVAFVGLATTAAVRAAPPPTFDEAMQRGHELVAAGRLYDAETAFRDAVAAATNDTWLRGEALTALARAEETRGATAAAIRDYRAAYQDRPTEDIRERVGRLDPAAARALNPFEAHMMAGPYASVMAFCDDQRAEFEKAWRRLPSGDVPEHWTFVCDDELGKVRDMERALTRRGQMALTVEYDQTRPTTGANQVRTRYLAVESVGTFGTPSLIPDIAVDQKLVAPDDRRPDTSPANWRLLPTGELQISPLKDLELRAESPVIPGQHRLFFP